ncbi:hypothetical protein HYFRA_00000796 [Hymenoscyphus fraxineus]|uniref:Uncharacterized protein n=1 Tax=Hymenoscyphus fraxineus TaxID=746836 RepID=A0A9N9KRA5_9HELO|nr:hypothetical protein HYFRA_00000796 [Hymenoscyphus fraxineus]
MIRDASPSPSSSPSPPPFPARGGPGGPEGKEAPNVGHENELPTTRPCHHVIGSRCVWVFGWCCGFRLAGRCSTPAQLNFPPPFLSTNPLPPYDPTPRHLPPPDAGTRLGIPFRNRLQIHLKRKPPRNSQPRTLGDQAMQHNSINPSDSEGKYIPMPALLGPESFNSLYFASRNSRHDGELRALSGNKVAVAHVASSCTARLSSGPRVRLGTYLALSGVQRRTDRPVDHSPGTAGCTPCIGIIQESILVLSLEFSHCVLFEWYTFSPMTDSISHLFLYELVLDSLVSSTCKSSGLRNSLMVWSSSKSRGYGSKTSFESHRRRVISQFSRYFMPFLFYFPSGISIVVMVTATLGTPHQQLIATLLHANGNGQASLVGTGEDCTISAICLQWLRFPVSVPLIRPVNNYPSILYVVHGEFLYGMLEQGRSDATGEVLTARDWYGKRNGTVGNLIHLVHENKTFPPTICRLLSYMMLREANLKGLDRRAARGSCMFFHAAAGDGDGGMGMGRWGAGAVRYFSDQPTNQLTGLDDERSGLDQAIDTVRSQQDHIPTYPHTHQHGFKKRIQHGGLRQITGFRHRHRNTDTLVLVLGNKGKGREVGSRPRPFSLSSCSSFTALPEAGPDPDFTLKTSLIASSTLPSCELWSGIRRAASLVGFREAWSFAPTRIE